MSKFFSLSGWVSQHPYFWLKFVSVLTLRFLIMAFEFCFRWESFSSSCLFVPYTLGLVDWIIGSSGFLATYILACDVWVVWVSLRITGCIIAPDVIIISILRFLCQREIFTVVTRWLCCTKL